MLAFSINCRAVGCAFFDRARPLLATRRLRNRGQRLAGVAEWVRRLLDRTEPFVVALVVDPKRKAQLSRYGHLADMIRDELERANVTSLEIDRGEVARTLGLSSRTELHMSRELIALVPALAGYVKGARRFQSESERDWAPAILAAGAALTAVHLLTCDVTTPSA